MIAKPMKTLELHYPMIQFLVISDIKCHVSTRPRGCDLELVAEMINHVSNNNSRDGRCLRSCCSLFPKQSEGRKSSGNIAGF